MARRKPQLVQNVRISGIADAGMAVGRTDEGEVIFVQGAVPGDIVDVTVYKKRKKIKIGSVKEFVKYSEDRVTPFCQHFEACGGCKWQNLQYEAQVKHKHVIVSDAIKRIGKITQVEIEDVLAARDTRYYRNKLEYAFAPYRWLTKEEIENQGEIKQTPSAGFHISGSYNKILDIKQCHLQNDLNNDIRNFIKHFCIEHQLHFYNVDTFEGFIRNIVIRNTTFGHWMLIVSIAKNDAKKIKLLMEAIKNEFSFITSLYYVVNNKKNDFLLDLDFHLYHGQSFIIEQLGHVKYRIGPKSFFQTNSYQAKELFDMVVEMGAFTKEDNVYDLYCGLGSIGLYVADKVQSVVGIEEVSAAIDDARINAEFNKITNCTFYAGDVKDILDPDFIEKHGKADVVITDPPRAGMHAKVVETLLELEAPKIVYVSCNPATQARDLLLLEEKYQVLRIKPVDMFPHTSHVENIALLQLK
ncbi:MAG TPA: 23S rRNA (uracil(1939)-C(5))-methyltransferase RlmD [Saprospiraceae bacterium]|nr:23S rRNA (uracil(1939)-C(5))-methyltransferase RlmD [Saprospiraceae bacterium]